MKRLLAAVLGAVTTLGLASCGGGSGTASSRTTHPTRFSLAAAYQASTQGGGARFAGSVHMQLGSTGSGAQQSATVTMSGTLDLQNQEAKLHLKTAPTGLLTMLIVGGHMYVQVPSTGASSVPPGTKWVSIDLTQLGQGTGLPASGSSGDPADLFAVLEAHSDGLKQMGTETIRGAATTRYRAVLDLNKVAASNPSATQSIQRAIADLHTSTLPVSVWVDGQNRVRRLSLSFHIPAGSPSPSGQGTLPSSVSAQLVFDLFDYGATVQVTPPTDGVYDITSRIQSSTTTSSPAPS